MAEANTKVGVLGIKVWVCNGEVYGKRDLTPNAGVNANASAGQGRGERRGRGDRRNNDRRGGKRGPKANKEE